MTTEEQEERVTISLRTVYNPNLSGLLPDASLHLMVGEVVDQYVVARQTLSAYDRRLRRL